MTDQRADTQPPALAIRGLHKKFGSKVAVDDVSVTVNQGELYALLGPNGAGKTTTLRMATGLLMPDKGGTEVMGYRLEAEPEQAKARLAFLPDDPLLYGKQIGRASCRGGG